MNESKVRELFELALEKPKAGRAAFLDRVCGTDAELRRRIEDLLRSQEDLGEFLAAPTGGVQLADTLPVHPGEASGDRIGAYKLLQRIGEGGMGTVWMAEQQEPVQRKVALKIIKLGMDTKLVVARFEAERQALALMDHPNIAKVFDGGATVSGRPYFVMELVRGVSITEFCDQARMGLRDRLGLFLEVCSAIQHAHQKGVIHRDLKPSNVMVTLHDGRPMPKVIDFGIAKAINQELTQRTLFTEYQQILGTPEYMAPEQATLSGLDVDTRADVYSLGVLLYELLTGSKPFDLAAMMNRSYEELLRSIREDEPEKPSTRASTTDDADGRVSIARQMGAGQLGRALRGDLDWITLMAMEKDRGRRYETVAGLAADLRRFLADEPVLASPPSNLYRLRKLVRRNRGLCVAAALVFLVFALGLGGTIWGLVEARAAQERAEGAERLANDRLAATQKAEAEARRELARAEEFRDVLVKALWSVSPEEAQGHDITLFKRVLDRTAERAEGPSIADAGVRAELRWVIASCYRSLREMDTAARLFSAVLQHWESVRGPDHESTLECRAMLCSIRYAQGHREEAAQMRRELLDSVTRVLPEAHRLRVEAMAGLGLSLTDLARYEEAEQLLTQAVALARRCPDTPSISSKGLIANVLVSRSYLESTRGCPAAAAAAAQEGLALAREALGSGHPITLKLLTNLAASRSALGDFTAARALLRESLGHKVRVLGPTHPDTIRARSALVGNLGRTAALAESYALARENFDAARVRLGEADSLTIGCLSQLAAAAYTPAQAAEVEPVLRRWIPINERRGAEGAAQIPELLGMLAQLRFMRGEAKDAVRILEAALAPLPTDSRQSVVGALDLAKYMAVAGELARAREQGLLALERYRKHFGDADVKTLDAMREVIAILQRGGRIDEARALAEESASLGRGHYTERDPPRARSLRPLLNILQVYGPPAVYLERCREFVRLSETAEGADAPNTIEAKTDLGLALAVQKSFAEAEQVLRAAVRHAEGKLGPEAEQTLKALQFLATVFFWQGRFDDGIGFVEEAHRRCAAKYGADGKRTARTAGLHAQFLRNMRRFEDAAPVYGVALASLRKFEGAGSRVPMFMTMEYADVLMQLGRFGEALAELELHRGFCKDPADNAQTRRLVRRCLAQILRRAESDEVSSRDLLQAARSLLESHEPSVRDPARARLVATQALERARRDGGEDLGAYEELLRRTGG